MVQPASVLDSFSPDGVGVGLITERLALMGVPALPDPLEPV
jgi:hypothetical protein